MLEGLDNWAVDQNASGIVPMDPASVGSHDTAKST